MGVDGQSMQDMAAQQQQIVSGLTTPAHMHAGMIDCSIASDRLGLCVSPSTGRPAAAAG
jgi:hypothetical protein